jgi:hypothetical protein
MWGSTARGMLVVVVEVSMVHVMMKTDRCHGAMMHGGVAGVVTIPVAQLGCQDYVHELRRRCCH